MRIHLIGAGNVGTYLGINLHQAGHRIVHIFSRSLDRAGELADQIQANAIGDLTDLDPEADMVILAVHDDALHTVGPQVSRRVSQAVLVHTAGGVTIDVLKGHDRYGVLWPVQTLSAAHLPSSDEVPLVVNGNTEAVTTFIENVARSISGNVYCIDEAKRAILHLAATFANNFSNHMYAIAEQITNDYDLPFEILRPLIAETGLKVQRMSPGEAQTGAAVRFDQGTLSHHMELLEGEPELQEIYRLLSANIQRFKK
jgi:predicted short-subunit dehydrogenase-like oxidoreductase (DUF2520 family)